MISPIAEALIVLAAAGLVIGIYRLLDDLGAFNGRRKNGGKKKND